MEKNESNKTVETSEVTSGTSADVNEVSENKVSLITKINNKFRSIAVTKRTKIILVIILMALIGSYFLFGREAEHVAIKQFTNVYSFVPEKISKSAVIPISVPEGVGDELAMTSITFSPEIAGFWQSDDEEGKIIFKPNQALKDKVYYAVNMDTGLLQMSGDFYVDEDPKVQAIFPALNSETHEDSEITIVFNRPMVPLTTLSEQENVEIPVVISPSTAGKFKWISTRNLQFVPETTLQPSTDYTVEIKAGMFSVDGLPIEPVVHNFYTRPLRYDYVSSGEIVYKAPMIIAFNQSVDKEKTRNKITVFDGEGNKVDVDIEYGERKFYDKKAKKYLTEKDESKLFIYKKADKHGRKHLWDFNTHYKIKVNGAIPKQGTKNLDLEKEGSVFVPNVVKDVTAQSENSDQVRPDFFDTSGTLTVSFYEEVDKDRSEFAVKGLRDIAYAEKCRVDEAGRVITIGVGCEKETDKKTLIFSFHKDAFAKNENFSLRLEKIISSDGFRVNAESINIDLKTYPEFSVLRTVPENQSINSALDSLRVCSNSPVLDPKESGLGSYIKTEGYIVFGNSLYSRLVTEGERSRFCKAGEFETEIKYGLLPQTDYHLDTNFTDVFGQTSAWVIDFKTGDPKENYTRFHNMQQVYNVTTPEKTKLTYAVENLEAVDMHICRLSPENFLKQTVNQNYQEGNLPPVNDVCEKVITEKITLPARYWVNNYFTINLANYFPDTRGHYILTFSSPLYKDTYENKLLYDRTFVSVTNLAIGKKEVVRSGEEWSDVNGNPDKSKVLDEKISEAKNIYWINNIKNLSPIVGGMVTQYTGGYDKSFVETNSSFTDLDGIANLQIQKDLVGAVVKFQGDSAVITDWADVLSYASPVHDASKTYVYTDRPIYRPSQTVHIKGIDRVGFDGSYEVFDKKPLPIEIFDPMGTKIYETKLEQSLYGTFSTDFELKNDTPLGTYEIRVFGQGYHFDVEEYVPSAFKLEAETDKEEYINGDNFKLSVQADYYFGVPLDSGTVSYSATAQDYYFDKYQDEYFNFGGGWYDCYSCGYGDEYLFRGEVEINENGRAEIERKINFADYFENKDDESSKLITFFITAKDTSGRSVSMQKTFIVHKGEFYLGAKTDKYYTAVNTPINLKLKTVNTEGEAVAVSGIQKNIYKVEWETFKRQEVDGGFYYRSEKKLIEVKGEVVGTDNGGNWSGNVLLSTEGQYEIHILAKDSRGNKIKTISNLYIFGQDTVTVPPNNNYELDLEVEKNTVNVGEKASLLIKSPYKKAKALISIERGTVYDYWIVDVVGGLYLHEFPVTSDYLPNIQASVLLLSSDPEIKYGSANYQIGGEENKLDIEVMADKSYYLPGEKVKFTVKTKNHKGEAEPAEVSLAVADLSVLALKGNPKKNPLVFFYDGFPLYVSTASNIKNILHEVDIPLGTKGGGGASPDDLATKKRGVFKDTAFWQAQVETDADGNAVVEFTLPDNLTTWQIETLGVTKDTKLGVDYKEFTTKKDLMALPLKPRFVVAGDTFSLGAKIFNQTDSGKTVDVSLESSTLSFKDKNSTSVFINSGESKTVYFEVVASSTMQIGEHVFTFKAASENLADIVEQVIPITPNDNYETVATANFTKDNLSTEYIYVPDEVIDGKGGLTINANATMAVFMTDALKYMVTYPYGCSEQLASSLSTIGSLTSALTLPNVEGEFDTITHEGKTYSVDDVVANGLKKIYEAQTYSGGFSYYKGLQPNLSLTMHVVLALDILKKAGYEIRGSVIENALKFVESETSRLYEQNPDQQKEAVILAEYILRKVSSNDKTKLTNIVKELIEDDAFVNEKISSVSLAYLAIITVDDFGWGGEKKVYKAFLNRLKIDGRGAYLESVGNINSDYFETGIKNTALALEVFVAHKDENPAMGNVLRWLLASRDHRGVWGSTQNTFSVVNAMVEYLKWQHETEAEFTLLGLLKGMEIFKFDFNSENIFSTQTKFISIDDLPRKELLPLTFERTNKDTNSMNTNLYYDLSLRYYLPIDLLPPRDEGITITRSILPLQSEENSTSINQVKVGEVVKGKLVVTIPSYYQHIAVEDFIPAGFEIINFNLATEDQSLLQEESYDDFINYDYENPSSGTYGSSVEEFGSYSDYGGKSKKLPIGILHPTHVESHDDRVFAYVERVSPGVYEYEYFMRALVPGVFQQLPAKAEVLYFPEVFGRTSGEMITVTP
jgi:uncharacterized protein YfaS (alpha-2-macroglobulin family)